jgi:hypothetical protein
MRTTIWTGTFSALIAAVATVAVTAQATSTPQTGTSTPQTATAPQTTTAQSEGKVTLTGCLKAASSAASSAASTTAGTAGTAGSPDTTAATGTAGTSGTTAGAAGPDAQFLLTNATRSTESSTGGTTAGSTADAASPSGAGLTYRLVANPAALSPHVGKKLEVTGTLSESRSGSSPSATTDPAGSAANAPSLRVEAGKVLSTPCTE